MYHVYNTFIINFSSSKILFYNTIYIFRLFIKNNFIPCSYYTRVYDKICTNKFTNQNIRHSRFTKICFDHKYLSNTINKNYKNYTVGFVLKNTIIILFLKIFYQHKLRVTNGQSWTRTSCVPYIVKRKEYIFLLYL